MQNDAGSLDELDHQPDDQGLPKLTRRTRAMQWVRTHRTRTIAGVGVFLVVTAAITAFALLSQPGYPTPASHIATTAPEPDPEYFSPLTGNKVKSEAVTKQAVTAIMIENSPDARPHSGLKDAGVVYEAIAEGGITRFVALYQESKPSLVGPVRSLRPYFVDWLAPYQASVAHVGGSAKALNTVRNGKFRDIDQFFNADYYWRASDRYAPHNVYTSFAKLDALNKAKGYTTSKFESFPRTDGEPAETLNATKVSINVSSSSYNLRYIYSKKSNAYKRYYEGNVPHNDREKGQLIPKVVVALHVNESTVMEDGARERITTSGSGKAEIFQNGTVIKATWKKASQFKPLTLVDANGKEIELVRGQTWITAVPNGRGSVSWK